MFATPDFLISGTVVRLDSFQLVVGLMCNLTSISCVGELAFSSWAFDDIAILATLSGSLLTYVSFFFAYLETESLFSLDPFSGT